MNMPKNSKSLMFDIVVRTATGLVYCLYLKRMANKLSLSDTETNRQTWSMNEAHDWHGHPNTDKTREIVRSLSLNVAQGVIESCQTCTLAKEKEECCAARPA